MGGPVGEEGPGHACLGCALRLAGLLHGTAGPLSGAALVRLGPRAHLPACRRTAPTNTSCALPRCRLSGRPVWWQGGAGSGRDRLVPLHHVHP